MSNENKVDIDQCPDELVNLISFCILLDSLSLLLLLLLLLMVNKNKTKNIKIDYYNQTIKTKGMKSRDEIKSCFMIRFVRARCHDLKYQPGAVT